MVILNYLSRLFVVLFLIFYLAFWSPKNHLWSQFHAIDKHLHRKHIWTFNWNSFLTAMFVLSLCFSAFFFSKFFDWKCLVMLIEKLKMLIENVFWSNQCKVWIVQVMSVLQLRQQFVDFLSYFAHLFLTLQWRYRSPCVEPGAQFAHLFCRCCHAKTNVDFWRNKTAQMVRLTDTFRRFLSMCRSCHEYI